MEFPELIYEVRNPWTYSELSASIKMNKPIIDKLLGKDTDGDIMKKPWEKSYTDYELHNMLYGRHTVQGSDLVITPELRKTMTDEYKKGLITGREIVWKSLSVDRIIFNDPATIVFWKDGTKTVVKCQKGQTFNPYFGFCAAMAKKLYGSNSMLNRIVDTYYKEEDPRKDKCAWCVNSNNEVKEEPCVKCKVNMQNEDKKGLKSYWKGVK